VVEDHVRRGVSSSPTPALCVTTGITRQEVDILCEILPVSPAKSWICAAATVVTVSSSAPGNGAMRRC